MSTDPLLTWAPKNRNDIVGVNACNETTDWVALSAYGMKVRHFMYAVTLGTVATWITGKSSLRLPSHCRSPIPIF